MSRIRSTIGGVIDCTIGKDYGVEILVEIEIVKNIKIVMPWQVISRDQSPIYSIVFRFQRPSEVRPNSSPVWLPGSILKKCSLRMPLPLKFHVFNVYR